MCIRDRVFDEPDKTLTTGIDATASRRYLAIRTEGYDENELRVVPLDAPDAKPVVVLPKVKGVRNYADHLRGRWVIRTNEGARNFRLVFAPEAAPSDRSAWVDFVPHRADAAVDGFALFDAGVAVAERADANPRVRVIPWSGGLGRVVPVHESAYSMALGDNPDPANPFVRVGFTSMVTPRTVIDVNLVSGEQTVRKMQPVLGYDRTKYETIRQWAPSAML